MMVSSQLALLAFCFHAASAVLMPSPLGQYGVGIREYILNKTTPNDPTASVGGGKDVIVSVYYPTQHKTTKSQPYFDPANAKIYEAAFGFPNGSLETIETLLQPNAPFLELEHECKELPTLVFSPGGGVNGYMYYMTLADLASIGYTTIIIDHPGELPAIRYPDGHTDFGLDINLNWDVPLIQAIYAFRITDMQAVVDDFPTFVRRTKAPINTSKYISLGHSIGGAAAAGGAKAIKEIIAGMNYDGSYWRPYEDVGKPIFMMQDANETDSVDISLSDFFKLQTSWYETVSVYDSAHLDFSDISSWPTVLGLQGKVQTPLSGAIGGARTHEIIKEYTLRFIDFVTGKGTDHLFRTPSLRWHEVSYVHGSFFNSTFNVGSAHD